MSYTFGSKEPHYDLLGLSALHYAAKIRNKEISSLLLKGDLYKNIINKKR